MKKRLVCILLVLVMMVGLLPTAVLAADAVPTAKAAAAKTVEMDFVETAREMAQQSWWTNLKTAPDGNASHKIAGTMINSWGGGMNATELAAYQQMLQWLEANRDWTIDEDQSMLSRADQLKSVTFVADADNYGLMFYSTYLNAGMSSSLYFTVNAEEAGEYTMDLSAYRSFGHVVNVGGPCGGGIANVYVNGEKVLLGTANFILRMGIRVAEGINLKNGVFIAINMQFAGVFSIKYDSQPSVRRSLTYMVKHKIVPVLAVRDFNINPQLVETRFKLNPDHFGYPDLEERIAYSAIRNTDMEEDCAVLAVDNLHSFGEAISSGKRVQNSVKLNRVLGLISACLGVPLTFYLLFMQGYSAVTPYNMFYYLLLWLCPVLLSSFGATRR